MLSDPAHPVALACHRDTPSAAVRAIIARVKRLPGDELEVSYVLEGDPARLRLPAAGPVRIGSRLWEHTCCEVFIARKGLPAYYEFNFSLSGEWSAYAFERYRAPRAAQPRTGGLEPRIVVRGSAGRLELDAAIRLGRLAALHPGAPLALALAAVVEDSSAQLSYWALRHPPGRPDFHHAASFALEMAEENEIRG
jgi:hypothetical protein